MKAVLVGTDFMYRQDGKLVPIEINTNVAMDAGNRIEYFEDIWHFEQLREYLESENITKIYLEGRLWSGPEIKDAFVTGLGTGFTYELGTEETEVEDSAIFIRNSYSEEAVLDEYCADKYMFSRVTEGQDFALEYLAKENGSLVGQITEIQDNGTYPNFILKCRYPVYDKTQYPKMYKFDTVEAVYDFAANMSDDDYIEPYLYNADETISTGDDETRIRLIRNWSIVVGTDEGLKAISVADYTKVTEDRLDDTRVSYDETGLLDASCRKMFLTGIGEIANNGDVILEATDEVLMSDGTWKVASELTLDDKVMAVNVPTEGNVDIKAHIVDYNVDYQTLTQSSSYVETSITSMFETKAYIDEVQITFTDGTDWFDTAKSAYLTVDPEDGSVRFIEIKDMVPGTVVIFLSDENVEEPAYLQKIVSTVAKSREYIEGYSLTLDTPHTLVTRGAGERHGMMSIEHNATSCVWTTSCSDSAKAGLYYLITTFEASYDDTITVSSVQFVAEHPAATYNYGSAEISTTAITAIYQGGASEDDYAWNMTVTFIASVAGTMIVTNSADFSQSISFSAGSNTKTYYGVKNKTIRKVVFEV